MGSRLALQRIRWHLCKLHCSLVNVSPNSWICPWKAHVRASVTETWSCLLQERPEDRPTARSLLDWPVVKRYLAAGKNVCHWSQCQETSATEDQTATLHALEYRAGESDLRKICGGERMQLRELWWTNVEFTYSARWHDWHYLYQLPYTELFDTGR